MEANFWDPVAIHESCLSWDQCWNCLASEIFIYDEGKEPYMRNICDCGALYECVFIWACAN